MNPGNKVQPQPLRDWGPFQFAGRRGEAESAQSLADDPLNSAAYDRVDRLWRRIRRAIRSHGFEMRAAHCIRRGNPK